MWTSSCEAGREAGVPLTGIQGEARERALWVGDRG
jgi:hypothetical protein